MQLAHFHASRAEDSVSGPQRVGRRCVIRIAIFSLGESGWSVRAYGGWSAGLHLTSWATEAFTALLFGQHGGHIIASQEGNSEILVDAGEHLDIACQCGN